MGKERIEEIQFLTGFIRIQDKSLVGKIARANMLRDAAVRYQKRAVNQLVKAVNHLARGEEF